MAAELGGGSAPGASWAGLRRLWLAANCGGRGALGPSWLLGGGLPAEFCDWEELGVMVATGVAAMFSGYPAVLCD